MKIDKIPIANVFYLLCYAWKFIGERDLVKVDELDQLNAVHDLYGKVLTTGFFHLARQGLDRGYLDFQDDIGGVRGRINLSDTTKRALRAQGRISCEFEELTYDVLHNRILRSTLHSMLRLGNLDRGIASDVRKAFRRMEGITEVSLSKRVFNQVQLDRNRRYYRLLLSVCRLIHELLLIDERSGQTTLSAIDSSRMYQLYENFVINFYAREQNIYKVNSPSRVIKWQDTGTQKQYLSKIPRMEADVILEAPHRRIIVDTKFYQETLGGKMGDKLHSANLYQMLAYLRNREATESNGARHEGLLLYPTTEEHVSIDVQLEGHLIRARTIDLAEDWRSIHESMLRMVS